MGCLESLESVGQLAILAPLDLRVRLAFLAHGATPPSFSPTKVTLAILAPEDSAAQPALPGQLAPPALTASGDLLYS